MVVVLFSKKLTACYCLQRKVTLIYYSMISIFEQP